MGWLSRWIRTTLDYNPTFPLSALFLMLGLRLLVRDGTLDADSVLRTSGGLGVVQAYELGLLAVALVVLWPRRIAYETTAVLIVMSVVRWAAPFLVASHAAEGHPVSAAVLGATLVGLMAGKGAAVQARVGLDLRRWERTYDVALFAAASVALPLLSWWLSDVTGGRLSHAAARAVHATTWWAAAALLAPLALGLPDLGRATGALRSRRPAAVWRALCALSVALLCGNALWLGGATPTPFALLPLGLVGVSVAASIARAAGGDTRWLAHAPAAAAAPFLALPMPDLVGRLDLGRAGALLLVLPACAALVPLVAPTEVRRGLRSLGAVAVLAPLAVAGSVHAAEPWLAVLGASFAAAGLWRRDDRMIALAGLGMTAVAAHLIAGDAAGALAVTLTSGAALAGLVAWRDPEGSIATTAATLQVLGAGALVLLRGPDATTLAPALVGALALAGLGWRRGEPALTGAGAALLLGVLGRGGAGRVDPGVALVLLAFAALPVGAVVAVRRERARALAEPLPDWASGTAISLAPVDELEVLDLGLLEAAPQAEVAPSVVASSSEDDELERDAAALSIPLEVEEPVAA